MLGEGSETYRDEIQNDQIGFAPSFRFGIGTDLDVILQYEYLQTKTKTDYGQPNLGPTFGYAMPPVSLKQYYGFANYDFTTSTRTSPPPRSTGGSSESWACATSRAGRTTGATWRRRRRAEHDDARRRAVTREYALDQLGATLTHNKARDNDDQVFINQTDLTWKVATGAVKHTVTGGLDLAWERLERTTYAFDGDPATAKIEAPSIVTSYSTRT